MKGKVVTKRVLTPDLYLPKSYSYSNDPRPKKYSKSFIDLMEKAMTQLKSKEKIFQRAQEKHNQKALENFVHGIHPSQQRKSSVKHRSVPRKHFESTISQDLEAGKPLLTEKSEREESVSEAPIVLNSVRLKASFYIKARKSLRTEKTKIPSHKGLKEQKQALFKKNEQIRKGSIFSDHHIEPWSTNYEHQLGNKYF